jgi:HAD superfamily hydrolase (TIGR01490 family)
MAQKREWRWRAKPQAARARAMSETAPPARVAVYDLDRTLLRTPTFTLFLIWAAARRSRWRLLRTPALLLLLAGHAVGLYGRDALKPAAIRLMLGARLPVEAAAALAADFAAARVPRDVPPGAARAVAQDRAEGCRLLIATAAPEFYASAIGAALGFDDVVATRHRRGADGAWLPAIDGTNCYGAEKARRVREWLDAEGAHPVRAYSDHASDAPLFALADEAFAVGHGGKIARAARRHGWRLVDFDR